MNAALLISALLALVLGGTGANGQPSVSQSIDAIQAQQPPAELHQPGGEASKPQAAPSNEATPPAPIPKSDGSPHESPNQASPRHDENPWDLLVVLRWFRTSLPTDKWQTLFNTLLVIIGFLQWRVYNRQAKIMEGQRDISSRQTAIMDRQARSDRPFLFFELLPEDAVYKREDRRGIPGTGSERTAYIYRSRFRNYGKSPAVIMEMRMGVLDGSDLQSLQRHLVREERFDSHPVIAPGEVSATCERFTTVMHAEEQRRPFLDGRKSVWLLGSVSYIDMVRGSAPYETRFCFRINLPYSDLILDGGDEYNRRT